jgi:quercetin dioxygenase-like cupin family protein
MKTRQLALTMLSAMAIALPAATVHVTAQGGGAVPLTAEPHHHLVFENDYLRAFQVEVGPHQATLLHRHDRDYVFISLGDASVTNAVAGLPEAQVKLKDADARFARGDFAHVVKNDGDAPFRNVTIELLRAQGELRNLCLKIVPDQTTACPASSEAAAPGFQHSDWPQFETDETRVVLTKVQPHSRVKIEDARWEELLVALDAAQITHPDGQGLDHLRPGEVIWTGRGLKREFVNGSDREAQFVTLQLQPKGASAPSPVFGARPPAPASDRSR